MKKLQQLRSFLTAHPRRFELYTALVILLIVLPLSFALSQNNQDVRQFAATNLGDQTQISPTYQCLSGHPCTSPIPPKPKPTCAPPPTCFRNGVLICMMPKEGWCPPPTLSCTPKPAITCPANGPCPTLVPPPGGWCQTPPSFVITKPFVNGPEKKFKLISSILLFFSG